MFSVIHFLNNQVIFYFFFDSLLLFLILYTLIGLVSKNGETRILAFFIYFELIQLLLATILLLGSLYQPFEIPIYLTTALLIIGASGAETGIFLALFIRYFRLTGLTKFIHDKSRNISYFTNEKRVKRLFPQ